LVKVKIHYNSFPVASPQQVGDFSVTSPQHKRQVRNRVDLGDWLQTKMVYPHTDGHPSEY